MLLILPRNMSSGRPCWREREILFCLCTFSLEGKNQKNTLGVKLSLRHLQIWIFTLIDIIYILAFIQHIIALICAFRRLPFFHFHLQQKSEETFFPFPRVPAISWKLLDHFKSFFLNLFDLVLKLAWNLESCVELAPCTLDTFRQRHLDRHGCGPNLAGRSMEGHRLAN